MFTISRPELVSGTELTEYPKDKRFIKLPVEKYLGLLNLDPCGPQMAILNAINNPEVRFVVGAVSRRLGKTTVANIIGQLVTLIPNCNVLIMSPNYSLSQISFEEQRKLIKAFSLEVARDNSKDRIIQLENGSTIRMGSVNQVDSCVGRSYDLIIFDEAALTDAGQDAFEIALRPTLDKDNSKAIFISTPRGKNNWFATYFQRGFSPEFPRWVSIHADWRENPRNSIEDINEARRSMSKAKFEQEYEASFSTFEGQIYNFQAAEAIKDLSHLVADSRKYEAIMGLDIGFKDATVAVVFLYDLEEDLYYCVDEYYETEKTTGQHAETVKILQERWDVQFIFIDSAAQQTRFDWAYNFDIATINANKSVLDGIGHCQNLVDNNKILISNSCPHMIAALEQYRWDDREGLIKEKPKHDEYSHAADAMRYALYSYKTNISSF